jgi:glycosyltransferase involved in cell wall biosynthesis
MLHGKPVIASNIGGIPEVVEDGVTGLLFEPGNTESLARNIRYLWERPDLCQKMGEKARKKAMQKYCSEKYYKSLMDVYKKAIQICKDS